MRLHVAVMPRSSTQSSVRRQIGPFQASLHSSGYQRTRRNRPPRAVGTRNREKSRLGYICAFPQRRLHYASHTMPSGNRLSSSRSTALNPEGYSKTRRRFVSYSRFAASMTILMTRTVSCDHCSRLRRASTSRAASVKPAERKALDVSITPRPRALRTSANISSGHAGKTLGRLHRSLPVSDKRLE